MYGGAWDGVEACTPLFCMYFSGPSFAACDPIPVPTPLGRTQCMQAFMSGSGEA